jgi:predicted Ser/Thr protein kinase
MSETIKLNACPKCGAAIPAEAPQGLCPKCVLAGAASPTETGVPPTATGEIPAISRIAEAFPQLEILELIGRGGMGFVFKARQPHLDRYVALKLLPDRLAKDPQFAERFGREGRVLAKLNHPNIVSVFDFGQAGGFYFLLMEYVDGVNLREAMRAGKFSPAEALAIVPKICEALQYAHEQGVLHRDIKPENILLDTKGRVKIADFGIAKLIGEGPGSFTLTGTGAALGTPHYMAPEQLEKPGEVDHRADIYSLGVVFYEMLTGELPIGRFAAPSAKTTIDQRVDEIVFRALEKERELRQKSATEFKTQVESVSDGTGRHTHSVTEKHIPAAAWKVWLRRIGWTLVALLAINFVGFHITRLGNSPEPVWTVGLTRPWFVNFADIDEHGVVSREVEVNLRANSFKGGIVAALLSVVLIVFRRRPFQPDAPHHSLKAIWGGALVGLSLPLPLILVIAGVARGRVGAGEMLLALYMSLLPAIAGTVLGWIAVMDIHSKGGRLRGLPLALFAAMTWPSLIFAGITFLLPWVMLNQTEGSGSRSVAGALLFLIPAGTLTFLIWAIYATARWASGKSADHRRGVLKWIFAALLLSGIAIVMMLPGGRNASAEAKRRSRTAAKISEPSITFTITAVELREAAGERWLAIDYLDDVHGNAEKVFMRDSDIPGFKAVSRTSEFVGGSKSAPVRHQRVEFLMPKRAPREKLESFRNDVAKALNQKSFKLGIGEEKTLFEFSPTEGGSLKARIMVTRPTDIVPSKHSEEPAPFRQIEMHIPTITDDPYMSVSVTTDVQLPVGEYLIGLMQRPDGRVDELPAVTSISTGQGRTGVMNHILWNLSMFESNRVRGLVAEMRRTLDGRIAELAPGERWRVFQLTNEQGRVTQGFLALRSDHFSGTNAPAVTVSVADVPKSFGPFFFDVKLRVTAPRGYLPHGIGMLGDGSSLETRTMIGWSGDFCSWYYPREFGQQELQEASRQLEAQKADFPNGITILPGQRVPMFSVTNQTGTIFRGYFELPSRAPTKP